jgi:hypothetical protein
MMETLVETITDEHAASDLGAVAAANIPDLPKQKSGTIRFIKKSAPVIASSAEADRISDIVHQIENLKESDAKARLLELENAHEKTYFEIGGVLSVMQKGKWYDPCASLDEWVEKNTGMSRSKALALIQIYNAVAHSGITWAQVKHIEWTKLRAIAGVLNKENAVHWIGIASKHSKRELNELVQKHLRASSEAVAGGTTATHIKTFRLYDDERKTLDAALEKAKATSGTSIDSAALELICLDYASGQTLQERLAVLDPEALAKMFAAVLNAIGKDAATAVIKSLYQNVPPDIDQAA